MPDLKSFALALYARMGPLAWDDENQGWSLALLVAAFGEMFQIADDYGRDQDGKPGWSQMVDIERTPTEAIPWLGQFVGSVVDKNLSDADQRQQVRDVKSWARGSLAALRGAPAPWLIDPKTVIFRERDPAAAPTDPAYGLTVITYRDQTKVDLDPDPTGLTFTGDLITEAVREVQGPVDELGSGSIGIWQSHVNQAVNTLFAASTGAWGGNTGVVLSVDDTLDNPFPDHNWLKIECDSNSDGTFSTPPVAAAVGQSWRFSCWVVGPAGETGQIGIHGLDASNVQIETLVSPIFQFTGEPQRVTWGDTLVNPNTIHARARVLKHLPGTFWMTAPMFSQTLIDVPYVANPSTVGGSTSTRATGRIQAPSSLLGDGTRFWFLLRLQYGWESDDWPTGFPWVFEWRTDGGNRISATYLPGSDNWEITQVTAGVSDFGLVPVQVHSAVRGQMATLFAGVDETLAYIGVDSEPTRSGLRSRVLRPSAATFDIGSFNGSNVNIADSSLSFFACGKGDPSSIDSVVLHAIFESGREPTIDDFDPAAEVTAIMPMSDASFLSYQGNSERIRQALLAQKPAGIVMVYSILEGQDYESIYERFATYQDVYDAYATYDDLLNDQPEA